MLIVEYLFEKYILPAMPGEFWKQWRTGLNIYKSNENTMLYNISIVIAAIAIIVITLLSPLSLTELVIPLHITSIITMASHQIYLGKKHLAQQN
jgi:hypothetical protein